MAKSADVFLGFRVHTGWAAAVAVERSRRVPAVIARVRIAYEPRSGRFVFHQAAEALPGEAERSIAVARTEAEDAARAAIKSLVEGADLHATRVAGSVIPTGNVKLPAGLADILGVHSRIHAAEGVFYREALADACGSLGLIVLRPPERDLWAIASQLSGESPDALRAGFAEMGRRLGPPWAEDQKLATLAVWIGAMGHPAGIADTRKPEARSRVH